MKCPSKTIRLWRVSDCEELVGVTHRRLYGIDQVSVDILKLK
jgi:hypothetical protein